MNKHRQWYVYSPLMDGDESCLLSGERYPLEMKERCREELIARVRKGTAQVAQSHEDGVEAAVEILGPKMHDVYPRQVPVATLRAIEKPNILFVEFYWLRGRRDERR